MTDKLKNPNSQEEISFSYLILNRNDEDLLVPQNLSKSIESMLSMPDDGVLVQHVTFAPAIIDKTGKIVLIETTEKYEGITLKNDVIVVPENDDIRAYRSMQNAQKYDKSFFDANNAIVRPIALNGHSFDLAVRDMFGKTSYHKFTPARLSIKDYKEPMERQSKSRKSHHIGGMFSETTEGA